MIDKGLQSIIDEYKIGMEFTDFEEVESYEYEDVFIPFRQYLQHYPQALDEIVEADKRLIEGYESLKDGSYLKEILTPIYELAKKNVAAHKEAA